MFQCPILVNFVKCSLKQRPPTDFIRENTTDKQFHYIHEIFFIVPYVLVYSRFFKTIKCIILYNFILVDIFVAVEAEIESKSLRNVDPNIYFNLII